jgi:DNA-binding transcriptional LysR family regulator
MQLNSQEVLFFTTIAPFSSFSEAALSLDVPQPTISRKIIDLDKKLGKKLFQRSNKGSH